MSRLLFKTALLKRIMGFSVGSVLFHKSDIYTHAVPSYDNSISFQLSSENRTLYQYLRISCIIDFADFLLYCSAFQRL